MAWLSGKSDSFMVQKVAVFESELGQYDDWKTFSVYPAVNGVSFESGRDMTAKGQRAVHTLCPRHSGVERRFTCERACVY